MGRIWVGTASGCLKWFWIEQAPEDQEDSADHFAHLELRNPVLKVRCGFAKRLRGYLDNENQGHSSRGRSTGLKSTGQVFQMQETAPESLILDKLEISSDAMIIAVGFKDSRRLTFISGQSDYDFGFIGFADLIGTIESFKFSEKIKSPIPDTHNYMLEVCLKNGMLLAVLPP